MITKLDVFDFDGTLFRSPTDTPDNRKKYEKGTGLPWLIDKEASRRLSKEHGRFIGMRKGWFGRAETLEPPLVPNPAPAEWFVKEAVEAFRRSMADPNTVTLMMTGRHAGLKNQVLRICHDGKLFQIDKKQAKTGECFYADCDGNVCCMFLGMSGPVKTKPNKPNETLPWKLWIVEQYMEVEPGITTVEFWEDRDEHVQHFRELDGALAPKVIVNHIK